MVHCVQWTGIPLKLLLNEAGIKPQAKWLLVEGADASGMTRSLPIAKALDDCILAFSQNGERLRPEQGYPLRLIVPGYEGNMWVKWLRRIEVGDQPWHTREETSKYTDLLADGKARYFTWEMEAKSVLTNPCPEVPLRRKGFNVASGLAWSGRGSIKRVDVSIDGGRNWNSARLEGPILPKCLTRFYFEWNWDGNSTLLQSRAIDDTGYVQPTMTALQTVRGVNSIYHNNAIQTWLVNPTGEVENVRLG
jgi:sulfane dehydrogenase subunit SoxC